MYKHNHVSSPLPQNLMFTWAHFWQQAEKVKESAILRAAPHTPGGKANQAGAAGILAGAWQQTLALSISQQRMCQEQEVLGVT